MEPDILYHYTSLDALFSIITNIDYEDESNVSFTLRATHASFLNDLNEGRLLSEALRKLGVSGLCYGVQKKYKPTPLYCLCRN